MTTNPACLKMFKGLSYVSRRKNIQNMRTLGKKSTSYQENKQWEVGKNQSFSTYKTNKPLR